MKLIYSMKTMAILKREPELSEDRDITDRSPQDTSINILVKFQS